MPKLQVWRCKERKEWGDKIIYDKLFRSMLCGRYAHFFVLTYLSLCFLLFSLASHTYTLCVHAYRLFRLRFALVSLVCYLVLVPI